MGIVPKDCCDGACQHHPPAPTGESPIVSCADPSLVRVMWYGLLFAAVVFAAVVAVTR